MRMPFQAEAGAALPRRRWPWVAGVLAIVVFAVDVGHQWGGTYVTNVVDEGSELLVASLAAVFAGRRALACARRMRWSWTCIAVGVGCWAAGQAVWCYYEVVRDVPAPFPSVADIGFLAFPVLALCGLLLRSVDGLGPRGRLRVSLDGVLVAASLFVISWVTAFGHVLHAGGDSALATAVSLAYPIGDLLLLTTTLVVVTHTPPSKRLALGLLATGFALLSVADSGFAYLTATGSFGNGNWIDAGWVAGFALVAVAAVRDRPDAQVRSPRAAVAGNSQLLLPYIPGVLGLAITIYQVHGNNRDDVSLSAAALIMLALMVRQLLVLRDNSRLAAGAVRQAFSDALTGLANRSLFTDRLEHALELHRRDLREVAVLFLDLDDFKLVNDTLGHAAGDALLIRVAERLRGCLRPGDTLARLGGDEFAVLIEDGGEPVSIAERMRTTLQEPVHLDGHPVLVHASIGIAVVAAVDPTPTSGQLMADADVAMYSAKNGGKNEIALHRPGMELDRAGDAQLGGALAGAIAAGDLTVSYQPVVRLGDDGDFVEGYEALARWRYEDRDIPPSTFIAVAERQGLIPELTDLVLDRACAQLADWSRTTLTEHLTMAVNLSTLLLRDDTLPDRVEAVVRRHGLAPERLVLEVTESHLVQSDAVAAAICRRLADAGIRLALDDFGTGYSSLAHLRAIPLAILKIDRSFVSAIEDDPSARQLLKAIVDFAHTLQLVVVAEGVETPAQLRHLRGIGCESAQGYLLGRPQPARELVPGLRRQSHAQGVR